MPIRPSQNSDTNQTGAGNSTTSSEGNQSINHSDNHTGNSEPPTSAPWYAEGLKFDCTQCGDCCTGGPGAVWVTDDELNAIAAELGKPIGEVRLLYTKMIGNRWSLRDYPNGDCAFLDPQTRGCQVYSARPIQCRTWPFWPSNIETSDSWKRTCNQCPGSGQGQLFSLEDIRERANACDI